MACLACRVLIYFPSLLLVVVDSRTQPPCSCKMMICSWYWFGLFSIDLDYSIVQVLVGDTDCSRDNTVRRTIIGDGRNQSITSLAPCHCAFKRPFCWSGFELSVDNEQGRNVSSDDLCELLWLSLLEDELLLWSFRAHRSPLVQSKEERQMVTVS